MWVVEYTIFDHAENDDKSVVYRYLKSQNHRQSQRDATDKGSKWAIRKHAQP